MVMLTPLLLCVAANAGVPQSAVVARGDLVLGSVPPSPSGGVAIESLTLGYGFALRDDLPARQLSVLFSLGGEVTVGGQRIQIPPTCAVADPLPSIRRLRVQATARGRSGRTCTANLAVEGPIAVNEGWRGHLEKLRWSDVFADCSEQKAALLFGEGFDLSDPVITALETDAGGLATCAARPPPLPTPAPPAPPAPGMWVAQAASVTEVAPLAATGFSLAAATLSARFDVTDAGPTRSFAFDYTLGSRVVVDGKEGPLCAAPSAAPSVTTLVVGATVVGTGSDVRCETVIALAPNASPGARWTGGPEAHSWESVLPGCGAAQAQRALASGFTFKDVKVIAATYRLGGIGLCGAASPSASAVAAPIPAPAWPPVAAPVPLPAPPIAAVPPVVGAEALPAPPVPPLLPFAPTALGNAPSAVAPPPERASTAAPTAVDDLDGLTQPEAPATEALSPAPTRGEAPPVPVLSTADDLTTSRPAAPASPNGSDNSGGRPAAAAGDMPDSSAAASPTGDQATSPLVVAAVGAGALTAVVSLAVPAFIATADQAGLGRLNVHDQHMFWLAWVIGAAGVPTFVAPIIVGAIVSWGTRSTVASALAIAPGVGVSALGAGLIVLGGHMLNYGETSTGKVWVSPSSIAAVGAVAATGLALGIGGIALAAAGPAIFRAEGAE